MSGDETGKVKVEYVYGWGDSRAGGFRIGWTCDRIGFGRTSFMFNPSGGCTCENEAMSSEFVREVLLALLDAADMEES